MSDGTTYRKKTTRDKSISLKAKLEEAKEMLKQLEQKYPELANRSINEDLTVDGKRLAKEFNEIIKLSGFSCIKENLVEINEDEYTKKDTDDLNDLDTKVAGTVPNGRNPANVLPDGCKVKMDDIPKFCYFKKPTSNRGCSFVIDRRNPLLKKYGITDKKTTESIKKTVDEKFEELMVLLEVLDLGKNTDQTKLTPIQLNAFKKLNF